MKADSECLLKRMRKVPGVSNGYREFLKAFTAIQTSAKTFGQLRCF